MNILFHAGVGNTDRPRRWNFVANTWLTFANTLSSILDCRCCLYVHPAAIGKLPSTKIKTIVSSEVGEIDYNPDIIFTWNGISDGDQQIIQKYGREKFFFAELGFFDHYKTLYFDRSGTNSKSMNIVESVDHVILDDVLQTQMISKYKKPQIFKDKYIFVPLQDERDTQITHNSPIKTMYELLNYVLTLYNGYDIPILYKQHPSARSRVPEHNNLIEVSENVHHYLPYAEKVIGINSTVLFETLLYHSRLLSFGLGIPSRKFNDDIERIKFVQHCYAKQLNFSDLSNIQIMQNSWIIQQLKLL